MSNAFTKHLGQPIPQKEQARPDQVQNNAGGFVFVVDDKTRLERFLILGVDGGTYYVDEKKLTKDNAAFLAELIARDEELVEAVVRDVSVSGRAYRNSAAIFTIAALFHYGKRKNSELLRAVCRTGTHLFEFAEYVQLFGGWGKAKRRAVAEWYTQRSPDKLAYQVVKYRQRNGWTHRDMFRLAHPVGVDKQIGDFILGHEIANPRLETIRGFLQVQDENTDVLAAMHAFPHLPWEAYPTTVHKNVNFWKTLFYQGLRGQALLRNITRLARLDAFNDMVFARDFAEKLTNEDMIRETRLHPIHYLLALVVHQEGQVNRTGKGNSYYNASKSKDWVTSPIIIDALNAGFYRAFAYAEPANKRTLIGVDVSGSMTWNAPGLDLTAAQMAATMALTVAKKEPYYQIMGFADQFRDLGITPNMNLQQVLNKTASMSFGSTDCSLPMLHAAQNNIDVDTFVVLTDNETWVGNIHPYRALEQYRQKTGIPARLVVAGITATEFTIADPNDPGMLDVVGGDSNLPKLVTEFSAGRI